MQNYNYVAQFTKNCHISTQGNEGFSMSIDSSINELNNYQITTVKDLQVCFW